MIDFETAELVGPGKKRMARKTRPCWACLELILAGTRYYEYLGETAAFQSGHPYCPSCAVKEWSL